jgi:hypothetical protein
MILGGRYSQRLIRCFRWLARAYSPLFVLDGTLPDSFRRPLGYSRHVSCRVTGCHRAENDDLTHIHWRQSHMASCL